MITLFCKHKWKTHSKKEYSWEELDQDTRHWHTPKFMLYSKTVEIICCEKCGKIKKIEY